MREDESSLFSRLAPRRTATIYFILFISTLLVSITVMNISEKVFRSYTSCHGKYEFNISVFVTIVFLQLILSLFKIEHSSPKEGIRVEGAVAMSLEDSDSGSNMLPPNILSGDINIPNKRIPSNDSLVAIICDIFNDKGSREVSPHNTDAIDSPRLVDVKDGNFIKRCSNDTSISNQQTEEVHGKPVKQVNCLLHPFSHSSANFSICWNSMWVLFYHFVIFMVIHATLLASRVHGAIELNKYALETCSHLWYTMPLSMWSPVMRYPLLNESTFFLTYLSCTSFELITRKSSDASYVSSFFGKHFWKDCPLMGMLRIVLQLVIFVYGAFAIVRNMVYGYGSPMQIVSGFSMAMLMLWINSALTQLLQLSHVNPSSLAFNCIWSMLSLLNIWLCGFLFYISVYGAAFNGVYLYLQLVCWIPLLVLTKRRGKEIFAWRSISHALYNLNMS